MSACVNPRIIAEWSCCHVTIGRETGTRARVDSRTAPFYSVLVRVNPENPASTTDFVCDVCAEIPEPADGGRTYAFPIREDIRFQDGSALTAYDVAAMR